MNESCTWYNPACWLDWLKYEFQALFLWIYDKLINGFAVIVEAIPVPDFLEQMHSTALSGTISWFLQPFEIPFALTVICSAYVARFILRRIPFIG